jgi:hypothetical protein
LFDHIYFVLDRSVQARPGVVAAAKDVVLLALLDARNVKLGEILKAAIEKRAV